MNYFLRKNTEDEYFKDPENRQPKLCKSELVEIEKETIYQSPSRGTNCAKFSNNLSMPELFNTRKGRPQEWFIVRV